MKEYPNPSLAGIRSTFGHVRRRRRYLGPTLVDRTWVENALETRALELENQIVALAGVKTIYD